jgi:Cu-Zn family superoxide dismutase
MPRKLTARPLLAAAALAAVLAQSCARKAAPDPSAAALAPPGWADLSAKLQGTDGREIGEVALADAPSGVLLRIRVAGLSPGWHGVHLHMAADCGDAAAGFKASGGHVDPDEREHGFLNPAGAERGDLPNLHVGADGTATVEFFSAGTHLVASEGASAANGPFPLADDDGFAIVIHADADDHRSQPIGGAGDRIACAALK